MSEGHSAPPAHEASTTTAVTADNSAAPVPGEVRTHVDHHAQPQPHALKEQDSIERITPRPTFMENLANSRDSQFHLDRRDSSELERYFVSGRPRREIHAMQLEWELINSCLGWL